MRPYAFALSISITHPNMIVLLTGKFCCSMAMLMHISGKVGRFSRNHSNKAASKSGYREPRNSLRLRDVVPNLPCDMVFSLSDNTVYSWRRTLDPFGYVPWLFTRFSLLNDPSLLCWKARSLLLATFKLRSASTWLSSASRTTAIERLRHFLTHFGQRTWPPPVIIVYSSMPRLLHNIHPLKKDRSTLCLRLANVCTPCIGTIKGTWSTLAWSCYDTRHHVL